MKTLVTFKEGNKNPNPITKELELTPAEYDRIKELSRKIQSVYGQEYLSAYVYQI